MRMKKRQSLRPHNLQEHMKENEVTIMTFLLLQMKKITEYQANQSGSIVIYKYKDILELFYAIYYWTYNLSDKVS